MKDDMIRNSFVGLYERLEKLGESIEELLSKDKFEFIEYNFSSFRDEIVRLIKFGNRKDFFNLFCAQIDIKKILNEDNEYIATVSVFFNLSKEKLHKISKSYEIHNFSFIPQIIEKSLRQNGKEKITFDINDLTEFIDNKDLSINANKRVKLNTLIEQLLKKENQLVANERYVIKITDYVLYYRIQVFTEDGDSEEKYIGEFLSTYLVGLSETHYSELEEKHEIMIDYSCNK